VLTLWLAGTRREATLVTVLYRLPRRGRCRAAEATADDVSRAQRLLCSLAAHACVDSQPIAAPLCRLSGLLPLERRLSAARSCALAGELAARLRLCSASSGVNLLLAALLDVVLGCCVGLLLARHRVAAGESFRWAAATLMQRLPARLAAWLAGAKPLGVKLHLPLCESLSDGLSRFAASCDAAGCLAAPYTDPLLRLLSAAGALGVTAQAALLADAVALATLPLALLRRLAAAWLTLHSAGIRNLYQKLYRPRAAAEAYRLERLTVGALLLTPLMLLAPTLGAYCAIVSCLAAAPAAARAALMRGPRLLRGVLRLPNRGGHAPHATPTFAPLAVRGCYRMSMGG